MNLNVSNLLDFMIDWASEHPDSDIKIFPQSEERNRVIFFYFKGMMFKIEHLTCNDTHSIFAYPHHPPVRLRGFCETERELLENDILLIELSTAEEVEKLDKLEKTLTKIANQPKHDEMKNFYMKLVGEDKKAKLRKRINL